MLYGLSVTVRLSVTLRVLAKRYILQQKCEEVNRKYPYGNDFASFTTYIDPHIPKLLTPIMRLTYLLLIAYS